MWRFQKKKKNWKKSVFWPKANFLPKMTFLKTQNHWRQNQIENKQTHIPTRTNKSLWKLRRKSTWSNTKVWQHQQESQTQRKTPNLNQSKKPIKPPKPNPPRLAPPKKINKNFTYLIKMFQNGNSNPNQEHAKPTSGNIKPTILTRMIGSHHHDQQNQNLTADENLWEKISSN